MIENKADSIIEFSNVSIGYGRQVLQENLNLAIAKNDFIGLVGPNGSGKTTFLKTLLGNINPLSGKVEKNNLIFGYVPQRDIVQPLLPYNVHDVVMMGRYSLLKLFKSPGAIDEKIVNESLERVGISSLKSLNYNSLSGGQRQRVLIARALAVKPDVLILDEPTNGLDTPSHHSVLTLIEDLHEEFKLTILIVSHLLTDVANLVKKIMLFEKGSFQFGLIDEIISEENLMKTYSTNIEVKKIDGEYLITTKHRGSKPGNN
jgi:ABC-type Mn2+/Zn2+ transport system ATPase subunit